MLNFLFKPQGNWSYLWYRHKRNLQRILVMLVHVSWSTIVGTCLVLCLGVLVRGSQQTRKMCTSFVCLQARHQNVPAKFICWRIWSCFCNTTTNNFSWTWNKTWSGQRRGFMETPKTSESSINVEGGREGGPGMLHNHKALCNKLQPCVSVCHEICDLNFCVIFFLSVVSLRASLWKLRLFVCVFDWDGSVRLCLWMHSLWKRRAYPAVLLI